MGIYLLVIEKKKWRTWFTYFHQLLVGTMNYRKKDNAMNQDLKCI